MLGAITLSGFRLIECGPLTVPLGPQPRQLLTLGIIQRAAPGACCAWSALFTQLCSVYALIPRSRVTCPGWRDQHALSLAVFARPCRSTG